MISWLMNQNLSLNRNRSYFYSVELRFYKQTFFSNHCCLFSESLYYKLLMGFENTLMWCWEHSCCISLKDHSMQRWESSNFGFLTLSRLEVISVTKSLLKHLKIIQSLQIYVFYHSSSICYLCIRKPAFIYIWEYICVLIKL